MKKKTLRILAAALAALMLAAAFTGCGKKDGEGAGKDPNAPDFVYVPTYIDLPDEITDMGNVTVAGDDLYFTSNTVIDEENWVYETALYSMKLDGTGLTKLENYVRPVRPEGLDDVEGLVEDVYVNSLCADGLGNLWIVETASYYHYDLPEDFDEESDSRWEYYTDDGRFNQLRKLDTTGQELLNVDLSPLKRLEEEGGFYIGGIQADSAGNVYLVSDATIHFISPEGDLIGKVEADNWIERQIRLDRKSVV